MPRFFFDVRDQEGVQFDDVGIELPGLEAARQEARRTLGEMMKEQIETEGRGAVTIDIRSGDGELVIEVVGASDDRDRRQP